MSEHNPLSYIRYGLVAVSLTLSANAVSADSQEIKLVTGPDYAPYASAELPDGGVISAVTKRVFRHMGKKTELTYLPWKRGFKQTLQTSSDATFPYAWSEQRAKDFYYSRPINKVTIQLFHHRETPLPFSQAMDLKGLNYCQPLGYQSEPELIDMIDKALLSRQEAPDMAACFKMLARKRVDFVVSNDLVAKEAIASSLDAAAALMITVADKPFREIPEYLIISRRHPQGETLIKDFNQSYNRLLQDGELTRIWQSHLGEHAEAVD